MLMNAFKRLGPSDKLILYSHKDWQYRMHQYSRGLDSRAITQNMSRKNNCHDNASMKNFFYTSISKFLHLNKFSNIEKLQTMIDVHIDYYN